MEPKEKIIHHDIQLKLLEVLAADVFHFNSKDYLCVIDYHDESHIAKYGIPHMLAQTLFQTNPSSSVRPSTWSKQYHLCITTKVMDRSKYVSNL